MTLASTNLRLRDATADDLDFIVVQENRPDFASFICHWGRARHEANLTDPDKLYWVVEEEGERLGYVILAGLACENDSIELVRILIAAPDGGLGRRVLTIVMERVFEGLGAHRLWLDVFPDNARARHVYRSMGFAEEGTLRDALRFGDGYASLVIMSMLAPEYRQRAVGARSA